VLSKRGHSRPVNEAGNPRLARLVRYSFMAAASWCCCGECQRWVREEAERAETVVDGDDDDAAADQPGGVIVVALADDEGSPVDPHTMTGKVGGAHRSRPTGGAA
jgi:hypothetical protein